jgi:hypothetical protein
MAGMMRIENTDLFIFWVIDQWINHNLNAIAPLLKSEYLHPLKISRVLRQKHREVYP